MKTIYILADSRGKGLESLITPPPGYRVRVRPDGGATLQQLLAAARCLINESPCELVYIMGGICNITEKSKGRVSLPFETTDQIYQQTKDLLKAVITDLDQYDNTPVILCQLVGVDLNMANIPPSDEAHRKRKRMSKHPQQDLLNDSVIKINGYIRLLNSERGNDMPELASYIHKHHGTLGWKHHYSRLDDGVHPSIKTQKYWAKRFAENMGLFVKKQL